MEASALIRSRPLTPQARPGGQREGYVCWSRMQAEAGQELEAIIERKERERQAGNGLFLWGVGNAPGTAIRALARMGLPVPVVFSLMKGKARAIDLAPARTLAWRRYIDSGGAERLLPSGALVTSRGDRVGGAKRRHYALMCCSDVPLRLKHGLPFDPAAYRNVGGSGARVGASQVTALLRRVGKPNDNAEYEANMLAQLTGSYWVRLTDPTQLDAAMITAVADFRGDRLHWVRLIEEIWSTAISSYEVGTMRDLLL